MSELEHCRLAHEGKLDLLRDKIRSNDLEDLASKKDQAGRTALHWACAGAKQDVVEFLIAEPNVRLDEPDDSGWTPLMIAASAGSLPLVQALLKLGCDPNKANENKQRALHYACSKNRIEIVECLLQNGAQVNAQDVYGSTALHRAASKGYIKIVDLLLGGQFKASVDQRDATGSTALHLACEEERVDTAKLLLQYGADPYAKNKEEKTPVDITCGGLVNLLK